MNWITRPAMRLGLITVAVALVVVVNTVPAAATDPVGFVSTPLARGTNMSHGSLPLKTGLQVVVVTSAVASHGNSGWHSHPGGAIVVVQEGEITTYVPAGEDVQEEGDHAGSSTCIITRYVAGQAFIERPGQPLMAVNTGSKRTIVYATFPGVPVGGSPRTDLPQPAGCPKI